MGTQWVLGIDLGTTNSAVAIWRDGKAQLVPNRSAVNLTPSIVGLDDAGYLIIGQAARDRLSSHPHLTQASFKRYMGTEAKLTLGSQTFRAEELSAILLRQLKQDAENWLGEAVSDAVITVPAYFNDVQRRAVKTAGTLAGLNVLRLLNEPTAASLAFGLLENREQKYLTFEQVNGSFLERTAAKLLLSDRSAMPFWARLVPGFITAMNHKINGLYQASPELLERINPTILHFVATKPMTLTWCGCFLVVYWLSMLHFLLPGTLFTSPAGLIAISLLFFYIFASDIIMIGLQRWPRILGIFLALEFVLSALLLATLFLAIAFLIFIHSPAKGTGGLGGLSGLFLFGLEIMILIAAWEKNVPGLRCPGLTLCRLFSAPWLLMKTLEFKFFAYPALVVFSGFLLFLLVGLMDVPHLLFTHP